MGCKGSRVRIPPPRPKTARKINGLALPGASPFLLSGAPNAVGAYMVPVPRPDLLTANCNIGHFSAQAANGGSGCHGALALAATACLPAPGCRSPSKPCFLSDWALAVWVVLLNKDHVVLGLLWDLDLNLNPAVTRSLAALGLARCATSVIASRPSSGHPGQPQRCQRPGNCRI